MAGVRVVLVEDNHVFREALELLLGLRGGGGIGGSVASGGEAIELCRALQPDIALVDYRMPGLNGAETTSELLRASPGTRVVCLTAPISHDEEEQLYADRALARLTKH